MTVYGYARVSTQKQDLGAQVDELKKSGADVIFKEKYTGTSMDRPQFDKLLDQLKSGDTLVVTKLDRLARNTQDALDIANLLRSNKVTLNILNMGIINDSPIGNLTFTVFSAFAQFERDLIVARTKRGKAWAKSHNPDYSEGHPYKYNELQIEHAYNLRKQHWTYAEIEKVMGISESTLRRRLRRYKYELELRKEDKHESN